MPQAGLSLIAIFVGAYVLPQPTVVVFVGVRISPQHAFVVHFDKH